MANEIWKLVLILWRTALWAGIGMAVGLLAWMFAITMMGEWVDKNTWLLVGAVVGMLVRDIVIYRDEYNLMAVLLLVLTKVLPACFVLGLAGCMVAGLAEYGDACEEDGWSAVEVAGAAGIMVLITAWTIPMIWAMFGYVEDDWGDEEGEASGNW